MFNLWAAIEVAVKIILAPFVIATIIGIIGGILSCFKKDNTDDYIGTGENSSHKKITHRGIFGEPAGSSESFDGGRTWQHKGIFGEPTGSSSVENNEDY